MLKENKSVSIHQKIPQILATKIFKTKKILNPVVIEDVFKLENVTYNFRNVETLKRTNVNSVKRWAKTIASLGAKIWKILPKAAKSLTSLSKFKSKIKNWETDECPCRLIQRKYTASWVYLLDIARSDQLRQFVEHLFFYFVFFIFFVLLLLLQFLICFVLLFF